MKKILHLIAVVLLIAAPAGQAIAAEPLPAADTAAPSTSSPPAAEKNPRGTAGKDTSKQKDAQAAPAKKEESPEEKEKKQAENIERVLKFGLQKERITAINRILSIKTEAIKKQLSGLLIQVLKDEKDSDVKQKGLTVLGELKEDGAIALMLSSLDDNSEDVRVAAVYALQNMKALSAKARLLDELKKQDLTSDSLYTEALIRTLGTLDAVEVIPFAQEAIDDMKTTKNNREMLVLTLGDIDSKEQGQLLVKLFKDDEESVTLRSYAVNAIARLKMKEAAADINAVITEIDAYPFKKKQNYYNLYIYSVAALAKLGDPGAVPHLENALRSESTAVRIKAVDLLKELKDKRTIDILKYKMEYDPSPRVRKKAREALKEMGVEVKDEKGAKATEESEEREQ
jgi:HEAT repeat protein